MKFSSLLVALALGATLELSEAGSIDIYKNFLGADEVAYFSGHDIDKHSSVSCDTRTYGVAKVDNGFLERVHEATGHAETPFKDQGRRSVLLSTIRETTGIHHDQEYDKETGYSGDIYGDKVFIMFLNTNEKAKFVYGTGEDRLEVPAEAGTMLAFDGRVPHNAELEGGTLTLLGAHGLDGRMTFVGNGSSDCYDAGGLNDSLCNDDEKCVCAVNRALREIGDSHRKLRANLRVRLMNDLDLAHAEALEEEGESFTGRNLKAGKASKGCDTQSGYCLPKSTKKSQGPP